MAPEKPWLMWRKLWSDAKNLSTVFEELQKCQLLCSIHHLEKSKKDLSEINRFQHGTQYGFQKRKCDCSACLTAKAIFYNNRNINRRKEGGRGPYKPRLK
jgi:hypothetical protein